MKWIAILVVSLFLMAGCATEKMTPEGAVASLRKTACTSADEAGTCFTKLPELGIVEPGECCLNYSLCCGGGANE